MRLLVVDARMWMLAWRVCVRACVRAVEQQASARSIASTPPEPRYVPRSPKPSTPQVGCGPCHAQCQLCSRALQGSQGCPFHEVPVWHARAPTTHNLEGRCDLMRPCTHAPPPSKAPTLPTGPGGPRPMGS